MSASSWSLSNVAGDGIRNRSPAHSQRRQSKSLDSSAIGTVWALHDSSDATAKKCVPPIAATYARDNSSWRCCGVSTLRPVRLDSGTQRKKRSHGSLFSARRVFAVRSGSRGLTSAARPVVLSAGSVRGCRFDTTASHSAFVRLGRRSGSRRRGMGTSDLPRFSSTR